VPPDAPVTGIMRAIPPDAGTDLPVERRPGSSRASCLPFSPPDEFVAPYGMASSIRTPRQEGDRAERSLAPIGSVLPKLHITTHRLRKLEAICLIRKQRDAGKQELAYNARPFVLCGIPLRRPPRNQLVYLRRNGKFFLEITGHPRFGLPFGQDRLIPIWIATLALRQKSPVVRFQSAAQMLEFFHLTKDGRHYRRIVEGFQRVFAATIFFGTDDRPGPHQMTDCSRFHFFERMCLWFSETDIDHQHNDSENTITLSDAFFEECNQHRIPVEREVIAALANAPGVLDFYVWLVWKSWSVRGRAAHIPLLGPGGLSEQLGNAPYAVERTFRLTISRWLRVVSALWPQCLAYISDDGRNLVVMQSRKSSAVHGRTCEKACARAE
jgi:hypothetical protein